MEQAINDGQRSALDSLKISFLTNIVKPNIGIIFPKVGKLFMAISRPFLRIKNFFIRPLAFFKKAALRLIHRKYLVFGTVILAMLLAAIIIIAQKTSMNPAVKSDTFASNPPDKRILIQDPKSKTSVNKEFSFPISDGNGKQISKIKYILESAEIRDQIIVKGQEVTAVSGRTFLIINLKIRNEATQRVQVNTRDYIRLLVNKNDQDLFAPDVYNDPVEVQAVSTKETRLGFAINDSDKNLQLKVGEINGEKTNVELGL